MALTDATLTWLAKAGWFPGRSVSTDRYCSMLTGSGYQTNSAGVHFHSKFGGLQSSRAVPWHEHVHVDVTFSVDDIVQYPDGGAVSSEERFLGCTLCPIGQLFSGSYIAVVDSDGRFYSVDPDGAIYHIADCESGFLNECFDGRRWRVVRPAIPVESVDES